MLRYLLEKEFKQFFRNKFLPKLMIAMPLMLVLIFPLAADFEIKNINLSVLDNDKSTYSTQLIDKIKASGYFRLTETAVNYEQALHQIETDKSDIIIDIPLNFERDITKTGLTSIMISANTVNGTKGGLGSAYLSFIIGDFTNDIINSTRPEAQTNTTVQITPIYKYNPYLSYRVFIIPAIMVMLLAMLCGFLPALNIVGEKQNGTIEQMNVTPMTKTALILSKLIPYWIVGFISLTIGMIVARLVYNLVPVGNIWFIYLGSSTFLLAFSGFGLLISNYAKTIQQALFMMFFFVLTFIFLSGLYTPTDNMPQWAQTIGAFSPLKYIIIILRQVYLKGSTLAEIAPSMISLLGFALTFNIWAILSYHKKS